MNHALRDQTSSREEEDDISFDRFWCGGRERWFSLLG